MPDNECKREELSLTVQPKPKPNESLSSFIVRVATENGISMFTIRRYITIGAQSRYKQLPIFHQVDWVHENIDMEKLSTELGVEVSDLEKYTFTPLQKYFNENGVVDIPQYKVSLSKEIITNKRRYCPICLASNGIYKLLWQVSSISYCDEHHIALQNKCNSCGKSLPYVFETMAIHLCVHCGDSLKLKRYISERNEFDLGEKQRKYDDWNYLLSGAFKQIKPNINTIESLAYLILYVSSVDSHKNSFNRRRVRYFSLKRIKGLAAYIRNNRNVVSFKVNLQDIFTVSRKEEISVEELFNTTVPDTFINSFFINKKDSQIGVCLAPWCKYYKSVEGMREIALTADNKKTINRNRVTYRKLYACTGCYMRYGVNNTGIWQETDSRIHVIWSKVRPLFSQGYTRHAISNMLKITSNKTHEYLGYMLQYNILPEEISIKYLPHSVPSNLVEKFIDIKWSSFPRYHTLYKVARVKYGWSQIEFYYYAFEKDVLEYQLSEQHGSLRDRSKTTEPMKQKIYQTIKELYEKKVTLSIEKVAEEVGCNNKTIGYNGFSNLIKQYREIQLQEQKNSEEAVLSRLYETYKKEVEQEKGVLLVKNISRHLNRNQQYLTIKFPELSKKIVNDVKESKSKEIQLYTEEMITKTKNAIKLLTNKYEPITIKAIMKLIGLTNNQSKSKIGKHLVGLIRKEIQMAKELL